MFGDSAVIPIRAKNESQARELRFPVALVDQSDWFDDVMHSLAREIERGGDPEAWLDSEPELKDEPDLAHTARQLSELHDEGRNHIWAYYTRNLVRPIALSRRQVDVIVGNPPWNQLQPDRRFDSRSDEGIEPRVWNLVRRSLRDPSGHCWSFLYSLRSSVPQGWRADVICPATFGAADRPVVGLAERRLGRCGKRPDDSNGYGLETPLGP